MNATCAGLDPKNDYTASLQIELVLAPVAIVAGRRAIRPPDAKRVGFWVICGVEEAVRP